MLKRLMDIVLCLIVAAIFAIPAIVIAVLIKTGSKGPALFWSDRVGRNNRIFRMPKFRSMQVGAPNVATHLLTDAQSHITPIGRVIRKTSLDEVPQLWSILKGDMSFVGPRPALYNQDDLIALRTEAGVHELRPGLTGWAQINGRDEIPIPEKVALDAQYMREQSLWLDLGIIARTALAAVKRSNISH